MLEVLGPRLRSWYFEYKDFLRGGSAVVEGSEEFVKVRGAVELSVMVEAVSELEELDLSFEKRPMVVLFQFMMVFTVLLELGYR